MAVLNRFKELLAEKERRERRRVSYEEIRRNTGIASSTLSAWASNEVVRYDANTIAQLCDFFNCEISDLLVRDDDPNALRQEPALAAFAA